MILGNGQYSPVRKYIQAQMNMITNSISHDTRLARCIFLIYRILPSSFRPRHVCGRAFLCGDGLCSGADKRPL